MIVREGDKVHVCQLKDFYKKSNDNYIVIIKKVTAHEVQDKLTDAGIEDVRQYIATKIPEMIDFSKEQSDFIYMNINKENKIYNNLNNSIKLLDGILQSKKLDLDSIKIVKQILSLMVEDMKEFTEM
jgi:hypothetical protein